MNAPWDNAEYFQLDYTEARESRLSDRYDLDAAAYDGREDFDASEARRVEFRRAVFAAAEVKFANAGGAR